MIQGVSFFFLGGWGGGIFVRQKLVYLTLYQQPVFTFVTVKAVLSFLQNEVRINNAQWTMIFMIFLGISDDFFSMELLYKM